MAMAMAAAAAAVVALPLFMLPSDILVPAAGVGSAGIDLAVGVLSFMMVVVSH